MASGTGPTWKRIVQIRAALSVQSHLWPRRFNWTEEFVTPAPPKKCKGFFPLSSMRVPQCAQELLRRLIRRVLPSLRKKVHVVKVWCKSKACVLLAFPCKTPQLQFILRGDSQSCKLRSHGVTGGLWLRVQSPKISYNVMAEECLPVRTAAWSFWS